MKCLKNIVFIFVVNLGLLMKVNASMPVIDTARLTEKKLDMISAGILLSDLISEFSDVKLFTEELKEIQSFPLTLR